MTGSFVNSAAAGLFVLAAIALPSAQATEEAPKPAEAQTTVRGRVVDEHDQPIQGARVFVDWYKLQHAEARTNQDGEFELVLPDKVIEWSLLRATADSDRRQAHYRLKGPTTLENIELKLTAARRVELHVIDAAGQPIAGATTAILAEYELLATSLTDAAGCTEYWAPHDLQITSIMAFRGGLGLDYRTYVVPREKRSDRTAKAPEVPDGPITLTLDGAKPLRVQTVAADDEPLAEVKVYPWLLKKPDQPEEINLSFLAGTVQGMTDEQGFALFDWLPTWQEDRVVIWTSHDDYVHQRAEYDPKSSHSELTVRLDRLVPISGQVKLPDGSPALDIKLSVNGAGYSIDRFFGNVKTDSDGRYIIKVAPNQVYLLVVQDKKWASDPRTGFAVWPNTPIDNLDFSLRPATRLFGRVTVGPDERPVKGQSISIYQYGQDANNMQDVKLPNPEKSNLWVQPMITQFTQTDDDGRFELFVGTGEFDIRGPSQNPLEKFKITDETEKEFNFHAPRPEKGILQGTVVAGDRPHGVASAQIVGIYRYGLAGRDLNATTDAEGHFQVERELHRTVIHARGPDGTLAGIVQIEPDDSTVTIPLRPVATAKGRLVDPDGQPLPDRLIVYGVRVHLGDDKAPWLYSFGGETNTDDEGRFALKELVLGQPYHINVRIPGEENPDHWTQRTVGHLKPSEAMDYALGDLTLPAPYKPPTLADRIASVFDVKKPLSERFDTARHDAKLCMQRVLILFANPGDELTKQLLTLRLEDNDVGKALEPFKFVAIDTSGNKLQGAQEFARSLSEDLDVTQPFSLILMESDGTVIGIPTLDSLTKEGMINKEKVISYLESQTPQPLDARQLFDDALAQAKLENKRVIVQETATWCGPCLMLSRFLDAHRGQWEKDYLWIKMDHRWKSAIDIMKEYRQGAQGGIPWWAILDADGKTLITSNDGDGDNIGFPSDDAGRAHFRAMLERTAIRLTPDEITALVDALHTGD